MLCVILFTRNLGDTVIVVTVNMNELVDETKKDPDFGDESPHDNHGVDTLTQNTLVRLINDGNPKVDFFDNDVVLDVSYARYRYYH